MPERGDTIPDVLQFCDHFELLLGHVERLHRCRELGALRNLLPVDPAAAVGLHRGIHQAETTTGAGQRR
eukprot:1482977-Pyramimonas_sp.AAC.1